MVRLAPEVRPPSPFSWVAGAHRVETIAADIARADYRLGDLAARGLLDAGEARALLAERGLADLGFTVWASAVRLGPIDDPRLLARAAEVAMLLHGWSNTREVWRGVSAAVCRDNAQAVVITPDLHGFGETGFAGVPAPDQVELGAMARTAFGLRRVLGLADVPLALVGHSMAATSLLTLADADLGSHVSRVLVNPVLVSHDLRIRKRLRGFARASRTIGRLGPVRRAIVRLLASRDPNLVPLTADARAEFVAESLRMPGPVFARVLSAFSAAPPRFGRQRRLAVFTCLDDDWVDQDALDRAAADLGIEPAQIHRAATGGHSPHVELAEHPEWTARNIDQIVRLIDAMLITAREITLTSTGPRSGDLTATAQPTTFA